MNTELRITTEALDGAEASCMAGPLDRYTCGGWDRLTITLRHDQARRLEELIANLIELEELVITTAQLEEEPEPSAGARAILAWSTRIHDTTPPLDDRHRWAIEVAALLDAGHPAGLEVQLPPFPSRSIAIRASREETVRRLWREAMDHASCYSPASCSHAQRSLG